MSLKYHRYRHIFVFPYLVVLAVGALVIGTLDLSSSSSSDEVGTSVVVAIFLFLSASSFSIHPGSLLSVVVGVRGVVEAGEGKEFFLIRANESLFFLRLSSAF